MPFINLVDTHSCDLPKKRPDGSALKLGDEWQCDEEVPYNEVSPESKHICNRMYRWTQQSFDPREPASGEHYWYRILPSEQ